MEERILICQFCKNFTPDNDIRGYCSVVKEDIICSGKACMNFTLNDTVREEIKRYVEKGGIL